MGVINFSKANCKNCYSCVRACPVHAVRVKDEQAEIIEQRCIACGRCLKVCPKNAKEIRSELSVVKGLIKNKQKVIVSLAPSFVAAFGDKSNKICTALRLLGFSFVEETAIGAVVVTREYEKYATQKDGKCYLTSCCPAVNDLIKKHRPQLIDNLIPVISPMVAHARLIKQKYGEDSKVVFIGPCLAKKLEARDEKSIEAVLTFDELKKWLIDEEIIFDKLEVGYFDAVGETMRNYPISGGIIKSMPKLETKKEIIKVDGIEDCLEVFDAIMEGRFKDSFIEINLCRHGCIDGPALSDSKYSVYERRQWVKRYAEDCEKNNKNADTYDSFVIDNSMKFEANYIPLKQPDYKEIRNILDKIGKRSKEDELNCGTCGYKTCKDKAIAVYNGMAEPTMCLPFMKKKAETLSNVIFDLTPSIIVIVNEELEIIDFNPAAENFFNVKKNIALNLPVSMLIDTSILNEFKEDRQNIFSRKVVLEQQEATVFQSVISVEDHEAILLIMHDISDNIKQVEKLQNMKINAIEMAQQVIDKQMRVAQEIASLLGETTAETKVSLTKLKRLVQGEEVSFK